MPSETDMIFDWAKGISFAVTVCDCEGFVIYANGETNSYTISKNGVKKLIHQTPWYKIGNDGKKMVGGLVEVSIVLPDDMPHFDRGQQ